MNEVRYIGKNEYTRMATVFDEWYFTIGSAVRIRAGEMPPDIVKYPGSDVLYKLLKEEYGENWVNGIVCGHSGDSGIVLAIQVFFIREKTKERWCRWIPIRDILGGVIEMEVLK